MPPESPYRSQPSWLPPKNTSTPQPPLLPCQVAEHVQEQLHEVDSSMSKPTAESLFQLYLNLQELYRMKDFLPERYRTQKGRCWGGGEDGAINPEDCQTLPSHLHR